MKTRKPGRADRLEVHGGSVPNPVGRWCASLAGACPEAAPEGFFHLTSAVPRPKRRCGCPGRFSDRFPVPGSAGAREGLVSQGKFALPCPGPPDSVPPRQRTGARVVEWARLESECAGNSTEGSNPSLSARPHPGKPGWGLAVFGERRKRPTGLSAVALEKRAARMVPPSGPSGRPAPEPRGSRGCEGPPGGMRRHEWESLRSCGPP